MMSAVENLCDKLRILHNYRLNGSVALIEMIQRIVLMLLLRNA